MRVEVVYALPHRQWLATVEVEPGTTAAEAVARSGVTRVFPEIDPGQADLGIFGRRCSGTTVLRPGDRVEIHRRLRVDPKTARRHRARGHR